MKLFKLGLLLIITFGAFSCSSSKKIKCPDGSIAILRKDNDIKMLDETKKSILKLNSELVQNTSIEYEKSKEIKNLIDSFDQLTSQYYISVLAIDKAMERNPCDKKLQTEYTQMLKEVIEMNNNLQTLKIQLENTVKGDNITGDAIEQYSFLLNNYVKSIK